MLTNLLLTSLLILGSTVNPVNLPSIKDLLPSNSTNENTKNIPKSYYGLASWYGIEEHGKPVASGGVFNMYRFTAAHNSFKFGTKVKVTNTANGRSVIVTITDRGGFNSDHPKIKQKTKDRRELDLSYAAFKAIANPGLGKIYVEFHIIK